jgi:hypothetical protein
MKYKTSWKSVQWELSCSMWMDEYDKANSDFLQFCVHAYKLQKPQVSWDSNQISSDYKLDALLSLNSVQD